MTLTDQSVNRFILKIIHLLSFCCKQKEQNGAVHERRINPLAALNAFEKLDVTARNNVIDWRHLRAFPLTSYLRHILMHFNGV